MRKTMAKIILCLFGLGFIAFIMFCFYKEPITSFIFSAIVVSPFLIGLSIIEVFDKENKNN